MKASLLLATLCIALFPLISTGQIYKHDFGATTISGSPYTVAPGTLNAQLSNTSWTSSTGSFTSYAGASGQALALSNSSGSPTLTLKFTVQSGYEASITSFNFWRQRSSTGAPNWTLRVNSTIIGSGTTPTSGTAVGQTNVTNAVSGLTGTVNIVISLSGATGSGTFRLDDFTLNGTVTPVASCDLPSAITKVDSTDNSVDFSWTAATGSPSGYQYAVTTSSTPPASGTDIGVSPAFPVSVTGLTPNTKHYIYVRTKCGASFSNWIKDSFYTLPVSCITPVINFDPGNKISCNGKSANLLINSTGDGLTYQWQVNTGTGYTDLAEASPYLNTTNDTLTIDPVSLSLDGYQYRCIVTGTCGADTSAGTNLAVSQAQSANNPQTICSGSSYTFNAHTYSAAGAYYDTLQTVNGCDSIIVTQLTVNPSYSTNNPQTICSGASYTFNTHTYSTAGTYYDTLQTVNGCDSIIVTQLTVNPSYSTNNPQTICSGASYTFNAHTYSVAGSYYDTLQTVNGCDSIIVTQLTVNQVYNQNNPQTICSGWSYIINSHTYTAAGTYRDTLQTVNGCDSIIVTQLSVGTAYNINNPQQICTGGSYLINAHTYTTAGIYRDTFPSVTGCDSIVITQLTVNLNYSTNNPRTICNGSSYVINAHTYTAAGTYRDTLYSVSGCDSIIVTQLTVNPTYTTNNPQVICNGDSYSFNAHTYTSTGTYRDTLQTVNGCDSIIVTQLTVNTAPGFSSQSGDMIVCGDSAVLHITVTGTNTLYQWLPVGGGSTVNGNTVKHDRMFPPGTVVKSDFNRRYTAQLNNSCGTLYSDTLTVTYFTNIWTGAVSSNVNNASNWACGSVPSAQVNPKNLVVPGIATNDPSITGTFTFLYVDVDSGRTLSLNGQNDTLNIDGALSLAATANYNGANGTTQLGNGSTLPVTPVNGTYYNLNIRNTNAFVDGNVVIKNNIESAAPIRCTGNLVIDTNAAYALSKVITEGAAGKLTIRNIGAGGRTGVVIFPVAASASGTHAVEISNTGVADAFSVHVIDSVTDTYNGNIPTGNKLAASAVNKTWIINEGVAGGSTVNLKVYWNASDELSSFTRSTSYLAHHNGTKWTAGTVSAANGSGPYSQSLLGVSLFSPFGVGSGGVLPVRFLSITAKKIDNKVQVQWTTASESNNSHFVVERSVDGVTYEAIGTVKGSGNSAEARSYSFTDEPVAAARLYYRIMQVDYNGDNSHSDIAVVNQSIEKAFSAVVYPNPSAGASEIMYKVSEGGITGISIFTVQGVLVSSTSEMVNAGEHKASLPQLGKGVYFIRVDHNSQSQIVKLIVN